jgi:hypothetical protein
MQAPRSIAHSFLTLTICAALSILPNCATAAEHLSPSITIPLDPLGFLPQSNSFLLSGASMLTVHYVDQKHLLLTYSSKRLLKRLADCPPYDEDRTIDAVLVSLPDGKPLAHAFFRVHDRGQYLWNLGNGRFMLRSRNTLTTFAPLENLASGNPFLQQPFITTDRSIQVILLSPDDDLLIVESRSARPLVEVDMSGTPGADLTPVQKPDPVEVDFFRLARGSSGSMNVRRAGQIFAPGIGNIPALATGHLASVNQGRSHWAFDFHTTSGKVKELAPFGTTCNPSPHFVSNSEFVVFGCHQSQSPQVIGGFNMRGEEMWEQNFTEPFIAPTFAYAPSTGRFALGRLLSRTGFAAEDLMPEALGPQTVTVYQTDSGRQIMRIDCNPAERAGQNFDLAPDGMSLAVIRNNAIEIYPLPALTPSEQKAVQLAKASAPVDPDAGLDVSSALSAPATPAPEASPEPDPATTASDVPPAPTPQPAITTPTTPPAVVDPPQQTQPAPAIDTQNQPAEQQQEPTQPRKPPTLYNEPGDKPPAPASDSRPKQ